MTQPLWSPNLIESEHTYMAEFMRYVNHNGQLSLIDYHDLHTWSIQHLEDFWQLFLNFSEINLTHNPTKILKRGTRLQDSQWFLEATLNFAENLLKRNDEQTALITTSERGDYRSIEYAELNRLVANLALSLQRLGLKAKDRVVAMLPNTEEAVIAMLATTSLGAVWSACSPDFGIEALVDRFSQIEPTILITVDGHFYKGQIFDHREKNKLLQQQLPTIKKTLLVSHLNPLADISTLTHALHFRDCLGTCNEELAFSPFSLTIRSISFTLQAQQENPNA